MRSDQLELDHNGRSAMVGWRQKDLQEKSLTGGGSSGDPPILKSEIQQQKEKSERIERKKISYLKSPSIFMDRG